MKNIAEQFDAWRAFATARPVIVCIPVYNGESYLAECLESVAKQTFDDFSVLVVDNASTDRTPEICKNYIDERFFYRRNETNVGALGNHNICVNHAIAKYVKILSADDVLFPDTLERQVGAAESDDRVGLVSCNLIEADEKLNPRGDIKFFPGTAVGTNVIQLCASRAQNYIGGPSNVLIRTSCIGSRRFRVDKKWLADLDFHSEILQSTKYLNIDSPGFLYRRHSSADSFLSCPPLLRLGNELWYIKKYRGPLFSYPRVVIRYVRNLLRVKMKRD